MGEFQRLGVMSRGGFVVGFRQRAGEQVRKLRPLMWADNHESPGSDLAMIGSPHGNGQDMFKLVTGRSRSDKVPRLTGAAGFEE